MYLFQMALLSNDIQSILYMSALHMYYIPVYSSLCTCNCKGLVTCVHCSLDTNCHVIFVYFWLYVHVHTCNRNRLLQACKDGSSVAMENVLGEGVTQEDRTALANWKYKVRKAF